MKNNLRQQILKELKFLLNEAPPNPGEAETVANILRSQVQRWQSGKLSDEAFKSILKRGMGSGGAEGEAAEALFAKLASEKAKGASVDAMASVAQKEVSTAAANAAKVAAQQAAKTGAQQAAKTGAQQVAKTGAEVAVGATEKVAAEQAAKAATGQAAKLLTSQAAESTTLALARNQAGKALVKSAAEKAIAKGIARVAVGQAVGSAVPGVGNIVMGVITGGWLAYDVMMAYVDYQLAVSGEGQRQAAANVQRKCENIYKGRSPEGDTDLPEEQLDEMVDDFAKAISLNTGYLRVEYYAKCLKKISSYKGVKEKLIKAGIKLDILSKDELCKMFGVCEQAPANEEPKKCPDGKDPVFSPVAKEGYGVCSDGKTFVPMSGDSPAPKPEGETPVSPVAPSSCKKCSDINKNCSGAAVREVQDKLILRLQDKNLVNKLSDSLEYRRSTFGDITAQAVIKFKEEAKFMSGPYTAKVGPATSRALGIKCPRSASKKSRRGGEEQSRLFAPGALSGGEEQSRLFAPGALSGQEEPAVGIQENLNKFYNNKKIKNAEILYEKLVKLSCDKSK